MKLFVIIASFITTFCFAQQDPYKSIHQSEWEFYRDHPEQVGAAVVHSKNGNNSFRKNSMLNAVVYGFHPYWMNGAESNYRWDLLTHLAYFSGDVNTADGSFSSTHNWASANVVNLAKQHGVKVHFTFTMFSGHATLLNNPAIKKTFINNVLTQINLRNADGCNVDVESMSSTLADSFRVFIKQLGDSLKAHGRELVVELPAVDWSSGWIVYGTDFFNATKSVVDYYFLMAYDYWWSSSSTAGPVAPLQSASVTNSWHALRSVNTFLTKGCPPEKLIAGFPYYGIDWPTSSFNYSASTIGTGSSRTYTVVKNNYIDTIPAAHQFWNSGYNTRWYYYNNGTSWRVTWYDDATSLGLKYDMVKSKNIAGTGMWALGYDGAEPELWNTLQNSFVTSVQDKASVPVVYGLRQNFPNPFNPVTTIQYILPDNGVTENTVLFISDLLGRQVTTLVNEPRSAGVHSVLWDASSFAGGVYFYTLQSGNFSATKKLLLIK